MDNCKIMVSVLCVCYNHEKYLRRALDSVYGQKTDFLYEVWIHDDASTDGSQEIIKEYLQKYPNQTRTILQKENQYSKGRKATDLLLNMIRGEYVVALECDDFWTDEHKLQKQLDVLLKHPECVLCCHPIDQYSEDGKKLATSKEIPCPEEGVLPRDTLVSKIANMSFLMNYLHTSSRMLKTAVYRLAMSEAPYFSQRRYIGDIPLALFFSQKGDFYFIPDPMTGYRVCSRGSHSERMSENPEYLCAIKKELRQIWTLFGECHPQYSEFSKKQIDSFWKEEVNIRLCLCSKEQYFLVRSDPYRPYYDQLPKWDKLKGWIRAYFPTLILCWRSMKSRMNHEK